MNFNDYLDKHTIVIIGSFIPKRMFNDIIVDNPKEFVAQAINNGWCITNISWWDHVKISTGSTIGYGGPRDPRNRKEFFCRNGYLQNCSSSCNFYLYKVCNNKQ